MPFELDNRHAINLDTISGGPGQVGDEAIVWNEFILEEAADLTFAVAADWWYDVYCNGELVVDTLTTGTGHGEIVTERSARQFTFKGHAGANLLAIHLKRGSASWIFIFNPEAGYTPAAEMDVLVEPDVVLGPIKCMNAVNNGPLIERGDQTRGNSTLWKAARIPFARNHDAAFTYLGGHVVDVHVIFPDFSRDPDDPSAYDFLLTDQLCRETQDCGTKVFYRLGSRIEHHIRKYGTIVPADFRKWAIVCEHIIRHFNEGWGNGLHLDIEYWEIWNEPNLDPEDSPNKRNWQGTEEEFHDFFAVAARHLKKCFPSLKIGGPAACCAEDWCERFLCDMKQRQVPMDFFSFHVYTKYPEDIGDTSDTFRKMLDRTGYPETELILDEWNYVRNWTDSFIYTIKSIIGLKGAVFTASGMCAGQNSPLDMLMYYDARPCVFNGLFDFYTMEALKGYYPFSAWSRLADLGQQVKVSTGESRECFATAATDGRHIGLLLTRFGEADKLPPPQTIRVRLAGRNISGAKLLVLDETHDFTEVPVQVSGNQIVFQMAMNTLCFLEI